MRTRFRGIDVREGVLLRGAAGWGEWSPFWDYDATPSACRGCRPPGRPPTVGWPAPVRDAVPGQRDRARGRAASARPRSCGASAGCRTAKVKVAEPGQTEADDLARVEAVRDALGPGGRIRVDANGGWDVDTAVRMDPAARPGRRAGVRRAALPRPSRSSPPYAGRSTCPIAADESIRRADDPLRVARLEAADIAVLKVQPLGGVARLPADRRADRAAGRRVVGARDVGRHRGRAGAGRGAAGAALRLRAGDAGAARRRRHVRAAAGRRRRAARRRGPSRTWSSAVAADETTVRRWHDRLQAVRTVHRTEEQLSDLRHLRLHRRHP